MRSYSLDLRERVVEAYRNREGTVEDIARQFRVGVKTIYRYLERQEKEGNLLPYRRPGRKPKLSEVEQSLVKTLVEETPDITLEELLREVECQTGKSTSTPVLSRLCKKFNLRRKKKSIHATERDTEAVKKSAKITRQQ